MRSWQQLWHLVATDKGRSCSRSDSAVFLGWREVALKRLDAMCSRYFLQSAFAGSRTRNSARGHAMGPCLVQCA